MAEPEENEAPPTRRRSANKLRSSLFSRACCSNNNVCASCWLSSSWCFLRRPQTSTSSFFSRLPSTSAVLAAPFDAAFAMQELLVVDLRGILMHLVHFVEAQPRKQMLAKGCAEVPPHRLAVWHAPRWAAFGFGAGTTFGGACAGEGWGAAPWASAHLGSRAFLASRRLAEQVLEVGTKRLALQVRDYDLRNLGKAHPTVVGNPLPWRKMRRRRRRVGEQAVGATKCHKTSNKLEPKWLGSSVQGLKMTMTV